jgi:hypothetical protein
MPITPATIPDQYNSRLFKEGAFDGDVRRYVDAWIASSDPLVATSQTGIPGAGSTLTFAGLGTAITLMPATAPAGTYVFTVYGVCTTTLTGNSVSGFSFVLGFTDDKQAQTPTAATISSATAGAVAQGQYTFRSTGTAAITFTPTSLTGAATAGAIAYTVTLQRLL